MPLNEGLELLRSAFAEVADEIDAALAAWTEAAPGGDVSCACETVVATLDRLAEAARLLGLEGQALAAERLRDTAQLCAMSDETEASALLAWLTLWRVPLGEVCEQPGDPQAAQTLLDYLALSPLPLAAQAGGALHAQLLRTVPTADSAAADPVTEAMAEGEAESEAKSNADACAALADEPGPDEVSLAVPEDVDPDLFDTFIAQAPDQLAVLAEAVHALVAGRPGGELLAEARRVAHTFKGSGNIIGIVGVGRLAHRIEDVLDFAQTRGGRLPAALAQDLLEASQTLEQMIGALRGEEAAPGHAQTVLRRLQTWSARIAQGQVPDEPGATDEGETATLPGCSGRDPEAPAPKTSSDEAPGSGPQLRRDGAETPAVLRVDAAELDQLTRGASQQRVGQVQAIETVRRIDERLAALQTTQLTLQTHMAELQALIERAVALQPGPASARDTLRDSEADLRERELHSLVRLATEMVTDGQDIARATRTELRGLQAHLAAGEQGLKDQHARLIQTRLVPFRQVAARLQRTVSRTAAETGKRVQLRLEGEDTRLDRQVLERLTDALQHLLRNAVDHGIEPPDQRRERGKPLTGTVRLQVLHEQGLLRIECEDDGAGLDLPAIHAKAVRLGLVDAEAVPEPAAVARWILLPGFSTRDSVTELSGRGLGLDVVAEQLRALKGHLDIATQPGQGTCFSLQVPATTGLAHALIVRSGEHLHALPAPAVAMVLPAAQVRIEAGRLQAQGQAWPCRTLASLLGLSVADTAGQPRPPRPAVLVRTGRQTAALLVDAVLETRDLLLQDTGRLLSLVPGVAGAALRADGRVVFLLDIDGLLAGTDGVDPHAARSLREQALRLRRRALVVDDSHAVRRVLAQSLVDAGWQVLTACNGFEALSQLARERVDIVLTDLEMPQLDGLALTRELRRRPESRDLPVLMITSRDAASYRRRAQEAGVSRYLTKPVDEAHLLAAVAELLGATSQETAREGAATAA